MSNQRSHGHYNPRSVVYLLITAVIFTACEPAPKDNTEHSPGPVMEEATAVQSFPEPDPAAFQSTSNFVFHQISWQYFLWLTSEVSPGKARFETLFSDAAIDPDHANDTTHVLGGVQQANSEGILVDTNGRAIYTTMMINDVYQDFVIKNKLYDPAALQAFPADTSFPVGALSLKAAWKIVQPGEDVSGFYTTKAPVQLLSTVNGAVVIPDDPKIAENIEVALVGFHIAIVVNGHPEAIWATFEHKDNVPYVAEGQVPDKSVSEANFTFYKKNTKMSDCNINNNPVLSLNEATQVISPVNNAVRQFRLGAGSSANQNNIDILNAQMHAMLAPTSVWRNYFEVGAIWFVETDALKPDWNPNSGAALTTGSTKLSNSVIETFTQNVVSQNNCFSCHNSMAVTEVSEGMKPLAGKNVSTSHILLKNYLDGKAVKR
ncbi:MAG: hypothetical protein KDD36_10645 [Flavobacteriales bacterium]|nr:hypothetical protein [Flavobacteriales bacterium]